MLLRYRAVLCDLLTALVDSWPLFGEVAGDRELGARWRQKQLRLVTSSATYRPFEAILAEAAVATGVPGERATELLRRYAEVRVFPDVAPALQAARADGAKLAVVTNCSQALAEMVAGRVDVSWDAIVSAERVGAYKPDPRMYRAGCAAVGIQPSQGLFVAGSPHDVPGAAAVGLAVVWVNRRRAAPQPGAPAPLAEVDELTGLVERYLRA